MDDERPAAIDQMAPWTIKAFPVVARERIVRAAQIQGVTVGQWIEQRLEDWEAGGGGNRVVTLVSGNRVANQDLIAIAASPTIRRWLSRHATLELAARMGVEPPAIKPPKRLSPPGPGDTVASRTLNT